MSRPASGGPPEMERGGPRQATSVTSYTTTETTVPQGRAFAGPPCPGRRLWAITVLTCPLCGGMHTHRSGQTARLLSGRVVRRCPTNGQLYRLNPVQRRREARRG
jgi:hypothetical protein